jgi:hypothetical protein
MENGVQSVMTIGVLLKLKLCAESWGILELFQRVAVLDLVKAMVQCGLMKWSAKGTRRTSEVALMMVGAHTDVPTRRMLVLFAKRKFV